jgi:hypothetical protein
MFSKNRNGAAGLRYNYRLGASQITYDAFIEQQVSEGPFELSEEVLSF